MDVSCPRCKTEYEFDDARVPDAGVTVKCTSCSHVFRVRRKSSASPRPSDETLPHTQKSAGAMFAGPQTREWKVRQASGNVFSFKELTTLQKWIVERKVSRDDEISLTGEAWKRLGNIAELASFFQVVDEALKAQQLEALQKVQPPPPPPISAPTQASPAAGAREGLLVQPDELTAPPAALPPKPPSIQQPRLTDTLREPAFAATPPPERPPQFRPPPASTDSELTQRAQGGGAAKWVGLALVLLGLGGAGAYYVAEYQPEQIRAQAAADEARVAKEAAARAQAAEAEAKKAQEVAAAALATATAEAQARAQAEGALDAGPPDAGAPQAAAAVDAGGAAAEPVHHDADYWIGLGDRYRDKERPEAALDAYIHALEQQPKNVEALTGKGLCLLDQAKPGQAEAVLARATALNPRYAPALMGLAESYRLQQKTDEALAAYQKYLDQFPNGAEVGVARTQIERLKK